MKFPLEVRALEKTYQRKGQAPLEAVRGVSFNVAPGQCFGLLGPNGAGKSTSMKCITGFYAPTKGSVTIMGVNVQENPRAARSVLGVCSQDDTLDTDFNVLDQMIQFGAFFRIPRAEAEKRAHALLERFGLAEKTKDLVEALSGGMRRRLQVARALINNPKVLVLDEPTTGLDPEARRVLWDVLEEERRKGLAILLSTHYMEEAERLCDRIAIIHQGRILAEDAPRELIVSQIGTELRQEELRPGVVITRAPNLEDVYLKITGAKLSGGSPE